MARQIGVIRIKGTIDELTFYEHPDDGPLVKKKTRVTGERVKHDPGFKQTMMNAAEFKAAIRGGQLLRQALHSLLFPIADGKLSSRMNKELVKVVQLDKVNDYGERIPHAGNLTALEDFEFNRKLRLKDAFAAPYSVSHNEESKQIVIDIPEFIPSTHVKAPAYVECFQLVSGAAVVDFEHKRFGHEFWATERIVLNKEPVEAVQFCYPVKLAPGHTLFAALGIVFYAQFDNIPKDATSQRKRWKVSAGADREGITGFTGALSLVKVIAGESRIEVPPPAPWQDNEWEMDGLGIA